MLCFSFGQIMAKTQLIWRIFWKIVYFLPFQQYIEYPVANMTVGYIIARPKLKLLRSPKRVCMVYTNLNDTYFWTVDPTSCPRRMKPGISGVFKFNTTKIETCGCSQLKIFNPVAFTWLSIIVHLLKNYYFISNY